MGAAVVEGVDCAADIAKGNADVFGLDRETLAGRQIGEFGDGDTLGHGPSKPRTIMQTR